MNLPLSVLDLSPIASGSSGAQALQNTFGLARLADRLGYSRYWLAEHHNMPSIASSAPEIMIGQVARETSRIRVGSGGSCCRTMPRSRWPSRSAPWRRSFPGGSTWGSGGRRCDARLPDRLHPIAASA